MQAQLVNGPKECSRWNAVSWRQTNRRVRNLRRRIFRASWETGNVSGSLEPCAAKSGTHGSEGGRLVAIQACLPDFDLGAAFLSNEAGILDRVRFENSAAYLASWVKKFETDPRMIVSATSQAQRSADLVLGIKPKESLQECQTSPEGMPLTWAQEHGIDTRIAGFAHRNPGGEGVSTFTEWKQATKPSHRLSRPPQPGLGL